MTKNSREKLLTNNQNVQKKIKIEFKTDNVDSKKNPMKKDCEPMKEDPGCLPSNLNNMHLSSSGGKNISKANLSNGFPSINKNQLTSSASIQNNNHHLSTLPPLE